MTMAVEHWQEPYHRPPDLSAGFASPGASRLNKKHWEFLSAVIQALKELD